MPADLPAVSQPFADRTGVPDSATRARISALRPRVSRDQAVEIFQPRGLRSVWRRLRLGPLRSIAGIYVPYRLYRVEIADSSRQESLLLALDRVSGALDLYGFERVPEDSDLVEVETRNRPAPTLDPARAEEILADKVRRLIYQRGFFRLRQPTIRAEALPRELHILYWVGFYGAGERASLTVMDAVRGRMEGGKARAFFRTWLVSGPA